MSGDCVALSVYFGERDRVDGHLASDVLLDVCERHRVRAAVLLRAAEGFGIKHRLHTQRLLTLSEDLPLVVTAVDTRTTIEGLLPEVEKLVGEGLVTLERLRLLSRLADSAAWEQEGEESRLTLYLGRRERVGGRAAYAVAVDVLRRHGVAGATVLLAVDGLLHRTRRRARFLGRNDDVPLLVSSIGRRDAIASAVTELGDVLGETLATVERVLVCKRDGRVLVPPPTLPDEDVDGLGLWQRLTVVTGEQARCGRHPLYVELVHRLRLAGASGATALRGIWGYSGDHEPHGDELLAVRRRVPVVVTLVDRPGRMREWWTVVDEVTAATGLVTSETVPAHLALGPGIASGGLRLARGGG